MFQYFLSSRFFSSRIDDAEAVLLVEADRPDGVGPRADQHGTRGDRPQVRQQLAADTLVPAGGAHVGVADQRDVLNVLQPHHAGERAGVLVAPERDAVVDFVTEFLAGHVRLGPAIGGDDAFVGLRAVVDDRVDRLEVALVAAAQHTLG